MNFANSLHEAGGGRQDFMAFRDTWDFFGVENQVAADQIGVWPMENWYVNFLGGTSPDAPMVFEPFRARDGEILTYATGNTWAIPRDSSNPGSSMCLCCNDDRNRYMGCRRRRTRSFT